MNKLFAVLLGGRAEGCNTELHDTVFVVGESLESCQPQLIAKWFGSTHRLHIDSTVELNQVDGYEISLSRQKPNTESLNLFFVNFGGYKPGVFGEIHQVQFYVAKTKTQALLRAREELCSGLHEQHCDDNLLVEDLQLIDVIDSFYIHLTAATEKKALVVDSYYRKLNIAAATTGDNLSPVA
ncbi:MAG: hypothetical protein K0R48_101 [Gammaproteobacteria bacterium]|jgi:hypothetical protein|nr:hypothetical protein [Gammaproteobacteria bacterium]